MIIPEATIKMLLKAVGLNPETFKDYAEGIGKMIAGFDAKLDAILAQQTNINLRLEALEHEQENRDRGNPGSGDGTTEPLRLVSGGDRPTA